MKYALIKGAAKGIGQAIAFELAYKDYNLLLVDKDLHALIDTSNLLKRQAEVDVHFLHQDLAESDAAEMVFDWYSRNFSGLEVLVNNAGFGLNGEFRKLALTEQLEIVKVNVQVQVALTYLFLPVLERGAPGYILNVGSTTAYQTVPFCTMYSASKHFVVAFNRGLRHELRNNPNISLTCLSPGATDTDFVNRAGMGEALKKTAKRFNMSPGQVARIGIEGLFAGKREVIPGWVNKLGAFLPRFFPERFIAFVVGRIYKPNLDGHVVQNREIKESGMVTG